MSRPSKTRCARDVHVGKDAGGRDVVRYVQSASLTHLDHWRVSKSLIKAI